MNIKKINRKLNKKYKGKVKVELNENKLILSGHLKTWKDKVDAGLMVAKKGSEIHVVNDIEVEGINEEKTIISDIQDESLDGLTPDVLIIGAGVVGCAIARELTREKLDILVVDKEYDVAMHTSSRNDGMVHPGIDIKPGLLKKELNNQGNELYERISKELSVKFERCGQYLCFEDLLLLPPILAAIPYFNITAAGKAHLVTRKKLKDREPKVSDKAEFAVFFDGAGRVCPYGLTIAYAENAIANGAKFSLNTAVLDMDVRNNKIQVVETNRGKIYPKLVINASGVFSEEIASMANDRFFSIHPRKGTNIILDKEARKNVKTIYSLMGSQSSSDHTKGGGVVGTVDGNVLIGPNAIETNEKENYDTDAKSVKNIIKKQQKAGRWLDSKDIITYFTGTRAATYEEDFIVEEGRNTENIIHVAGIQSPGLTAAPAIGVRIHRMAKEKLKKEMKIWVNPYFNEARDPIPEIAKMDFKKRQEYIKKNPQYGEIICRCEEISKGEIIDAMKRGLPCDTVDGIKRRVRPGMGRCQGSFCGPQILKIISKEKNKPLEEVKKGYENSNIVLGDKNEL